MVECEKNLKGTEIIFKKSEFYFLNYETLGIEVIKATVGR